MEMPRVVSREAWLRQLKDLLVKEKEWNRQRDALSAERRKLPMVRIEKDYVFEGPNGRRTLGDLFEGRRQLIVYHFMFDPAWDEGCKSCSFVADNFTGALELRPAPKARNAAHPQERQRSAAVGGKRDDSASRCESQAGWNFRTGHLYPGLCRHVPSPLKISKFAHNAALHFLALVKEYGLDESTRSDLSTSRKTAPVPGTFRE